ncbi:TlpA family protein disulfide reductase [Rubinisphaera italica]|uniref:Sporulation thiol-disulfide oxidoreductase A n=1 Tax=Rubinisphaera italica TaxID=2527969 RepID=A0A5C5XC91_9PLAN|nr:TlpA disulfide reductase family protein [Rubinisphaera italica]TWT59913.1 Sporulation thiol-disulfide oxidoreductase A precursor [Rubinisphaera italica]
MIRHLSSGSAFLILLMVFSLNRISAEEQPKGSVADVSVHMQSWEELQDWVASQKGKVVVVDVWSTFCLPCVREFPHFVEFHENHKDHVACASLNIDYYGGKGQKPEDNREKVLKFLKSRNATMHNIIAINPDEVVLQQIKTAAIPAAIIYDRNGKLHKFFNNDEDLYGPKGFNYEQHITPLVEKLLK